MASGRGRSSVDDVEELSLLRKGAEASLYLASWHGRKVVMKKRLPKRYRPRELDERIRGYRTIHESQLMHAAKQAGVPTPVILLVDVKEATIIMQYVEGKQLKQLLGEAARNARCRLCQTVGKLIGNLHAAGIVHGDLTTSNMILSSAGRIFFVDFGLAERTAELEARGVDLHLMKRVMCSTHFAVADQCFRDTMEGYASVVGERATEDVLAKIGEIEKRGRYVTGRRLQAER